jgi:hypothetical protein
MKIQNSSIKQDMVLKNNGAIKIQSLVRGHLARQTIKQNTTALKNMNLVQPKCLIEDNGNVRSATSINDILKSKEAAKEIMLYLTTKDLVTLSSVKKSFRDITNNFSLQRQQELVNESGITGLIPQTNNSRNNIKIMHDLKKSIDDLKIKDIKAIATASSTFIVECINAPANTVPAFSEPCDGVNATNNVVPTAPPFIESCEGVNATDRHEPANTNQARDLRGGAVDLICFFCELSFCILRIISACA